MVRSRLVVPSGEASNNKKDSFGNHLFSSKAKPPSSSSSTSTRSYLSSFLLPSSFSKKNNHSSSSSVRRSARRKQRNNNVATPAGGIFSGLFSISSWSSTFSTSHRKQRHNIKNNNSTRRTTRAQQQSMLNVDKNKILVWCFVVVFLLILLWLCYKIISFFVISILFGFFGVVSSSSHNHFKVDTKSIYVQNVDNWFLKSKKAQYITEMNREIFPLSIHAHDKNQEIRKEKKNKSFEVIIHPGDPEVSLTVPTFFVDFPFVIGSSSSPAKKSDEDSKSESEMLRSKGRNTNEGVNEKEYKVNKGKLITPQMASLIGSSITKQGDMDDLDSRTIFVSIISYRDLKCRDTIENLFSKAKYPERLRVGVIDQIEPNGIDPSCAIPRKPCTGTIASTEAVCLYQNQIDVYELEASLSVGNIFARHLANRLYRGEYYVLQIDSKTTTFIQDWDTHLVNQIVATQNEMAVITTFLSDEKGAMIDPTSGLSSRNTRSIVCNTMFDISGNKKHLRHFSQPESPNYFNTPQLQPYFAAGFSFARGHFILNVPYDPYLPMVYAGEDISMTIRGFTFGYDFYAPQYSVCFRSYDDSVRNNVNKYGDDDDDADDDIVNIYSRHQQQQKQQLPSHFWGEQAKLLYPSNMEEESMNRLLSLIQMNPSDFSSSATSSKWNDKDSDIYGIGKVRSPQKFFTTFGIHVQVHRIEGHLCDFVQTGKMHQLFTPHLRENGMGINYDKIKFRFHELANMHE